MKELFFDHDVVSDTGLVSGSYTPKTDAEYNRLEPFSVKAPEADKAKKAPEADKANDA